jgi:putative Mg2+ transporter-C (MgtC) family protein
MEISSQISVLLLVIIAAVLGGLIGLEREVSHKSAGLRTHMFVAASAAVLIFLGQYILPYFVAANPMLDFRTDPTRIIQAIVAGISFIGAGVIFKDASHHAIRNMTTATSVLFTAAVGIAVGLQLIYLAIGMAVFIVVANLVLVRLEKHIHPKKYEDE